VTSVLVLTSVYAIVIIVLARLSDSRIWTLNGYLAILLLALSLVALVLPARSAEGTHHAGASHWYPTRCCSAKDCHPVPCADLVEDDKGDIQFTTDAGALVTVLKNKVEPSQDAQCHICYDPDTTVSKGVRYHGYCAFQQFGQ